MPVTGEETGPQHDNLTWKVSFGKVSLSGPWSPEMPEKMTGYYGKMRRTRDSQSKNPEGKVEKYTISEDSCRILEIKK